MTLLDHATPRSLREHTETVEATEQIHGIGFVESPSEDQKENPRSAVKACGDL